MRRCGFSTSQGGAAFLWDESFLWGLMAYNSLKSIGLPFDLVRSADIKKGCLQNYRMLFVPGGWASNKSKSLGDKGIKEIKNFVEAGGSYLGLCGGAGLATMDGIGLLNVVRKPTKDRVPSFSGRIYLNVKKHPIWNGIYSSPITHNASRITHYGPVFHAYWPSQFILKDKKIKTLAAFGHALPDAFSSDLNIGDVNKTANWAELEKRYQINLDAARLENEPAVIEGRFGDGRVILSLVHLDAPGDMNGQKVLKKLWEYLAGQKVDDKKIRSWEDEKLKNITSQHLNLSTSKLQDAELIAELETAVTDLIAFGERNFLWFRRNPMLLQWRRGVRGLEYCTLFVMINEVTQRIKVEGRRLKDDKFPIRIKKLLIPFIKKSKQLLILERHALQNGHITYEKCSDPEIQKIRTELFLTRRAMAGSLKNLLMRLMTFYFYY